MAEVLINNKKRSSICWFTHRKISNVYQQEMNVYLILIVSKEEEKEGEEGDGDIVTANEL